MSGNNNVEIGTREIGSLAESEDDNPEEVIGFLSFSTTGEVQVPRDWLLDQWNEHDLPNRILPTETTNWQAFRRTISYLKDQTEFLSYSVENDELGMGLDCKLEIEKSNALGSNVYLVYGKTFFPEEVCGEEGGNWSSSRIGMFDFYRPDNNDLDGRMITRREIDEDNAHYEQLTRLFQEAQEIESERRTHHNFNDLQSILEQYRGPITNSVDIRRSVYFVPAHHEDSLNALSSVWKKMNQFKEGGEPIRIEKTPVVDMQEQRELVASRVRDKLEEMVNDIVSEVVTEFEDNAETTADEAANEIMDQLEQGENTASTYNQLLGLRLSIKEILEHRREEMKEESEEIIENIMNQQTFEEINE
jgi:hypothetical protein